MLCTWFGFSVDAVLHRQYTLLMLYYAVNVFNCKYSLDAVLHCKLGTNSFEPSAGLIPLLVAADLETFNGNESAF